MKVDIVIVSRAKTDKHKQLTIDAINSLHASYHDFNIIVMEQTDVKYKGAKTINYKFDFNYNKCLNEGAKHGEADYIVFCNNDLIFEPTWFDRLLDVFNMDYESLCPYEPRHFKGSIKQGNHLIEGYEVRKQMLGWCIAVKRDMFERIGGFDEGVMFWFSDNIYADQLQFHNIKHALVCNSIVHHKESATLKTVPQKEITWGQQKIYNQIRKKYVKEKTI